MYTDSYLRIVDIIKEDSSKYYFDTLTISDIKSIAIKNIDDMHMHTKDFIKVHKDISLLWKQYFDVVEDCGDFTNNGVQLNTSSCVEKYNYVVRKIEESDDVSSNYYFMIIYNYFCIVASNQNNNNDLSRLKIYNSSNIIE